MIAPSSGGPPLNDDRLGPMNSQLALRIAVVGTVALLLFAVVFLRLWFLQVLTGNSYVAQAKGNIVRKVPVAAPRGAILAADNSVLVDSVKVPAILVEPQQLPVALSTSIHGVSDPPADDAIYRRLAVALNMSAKPSTCRYTLTVDNGAGALVTQRFAPKLAEIPCIIAQHAADFQNGTVTIATNVPTAEQAYISERQRSFRGVEVTQISVSEYPQKTLAAQLLGTIGANAAGNGSALFRNVAAYDSVGQTGLEYEYNKYLQGRDGYQRVEVNAQGTFEGESTPVPPTAGYNLKTSINVGLERVGTQALARSISAVPNSTGGAFVAMDPQNGQVYGMGSLPTFDPNIFQKPLTQTQVNALFGASSGDPELNRATQSVGPDGSTFKVITATAALQSGTWGASTPYDDTGQFCPTPNDPASCLHNSGHEVGGVLTLPTAIEMSDDVYFYHLGDLLNVDPSTHPNGGPLQSWASKFGIGQRPRIDVPYAAAGTMATPKLINQQIQAEIDCDQAKGPYAYTNGSGGISATKLPGYHRSPKHAPGGCQIASWPPNPWTVGDNINAALGQGDVQVSPLQLAMVYSVVANGGTLVTPHIGQDIQTPAGQVLARINPAPERNLHIDPSNIQAIQEGLRLAASGPRGTSTDVMGSFKMPVYGKTGTAQYIPTTGPNKGHETDYAWYACFVPATATRRPIVVVVWVEAGGFGDQTAAPVARQILNQWFYNSPGQYVGGSATSTGQGF